MAICEFHSCRFDTRDGSLCYLEDGSRHTLRPQLARLLGFFLGHPDRVLSRDEIVPVVWGPDAVVDFESGLAALIGELRRVLDQCGGQAGLVETVPRRGYRFHGPVAWQDETVKGKAEHRRWPGLVWPALVLVAALAVGLGGWWMLDTRHLGPTEEPTGPDSLAILPPETFGDVHYLPEQAGIVLADALLARLWTARLEDLELIGRTSMRPYRDVEDAGRAIATDLGASLLIEGSLVADEDGWTVEMRMLTIPGGRVVWSESIHRPETDRLAVSEVADELIASLEERWPDIRHRE